MTGYLCFVLEGVNIQRDLIQVWGKIVAQLHQMKRHLAAAQGLEMCFYFQTQVCDTLQLMLAHLCEFNIRN